MTLSRPGPTARDPTRLSAITIAAAALLAGLPALATGRRLLQDLGGNGLLNPDSAMRLVRLEDILTAHAPLYAVMRDSSGAGTILHWSHLVDSLLLLLAAPLAPLLGWHVALHTIALAVGPLCLASLGVAVAWAAAPLAARDGNQGWLWLGAFAAGASASVHAYGRMGVVHHHVLLAIMAVLSAGWAVRILHGHNPVAGGIAIGAAATAGLWFSPEALPFCLLPPGAIAIAWLTARPASRPPLAHALLAAGLTLCATSTLAWLVDPPGAGLLAIEIDRLSLPFVLIGLGAALTGIIAATTSNPRATLITAAALATAWLAAFPQILLGTEGLMTPDEAAAFMSGITEMKPVQGLDGVLVFLSGGLFAVLALLAFAWRARHTPSAATILYTAACTLGAVALAAAHLRFATYPSLAGAVLLPVVLAAISGSRIPASLQSAGRIGVIVGLLTLPLLAPLAATAAPQSTQTPLTTMPCSLAGAETLLQDHPGQIILAGINETPHLLYRTRILTVGSLYHRNPAGFLRLRAAWRLVPSGDTPPPAFRATGATLALACPNEPRSALVDDLPMTTLLDRLAANDPPAWLERLADAGPGQYVLYGVRP